MQIVSLSQGVEYEPNSDGNVRQPQPGTVQHSTAESRDTTGGGELSWLVLLAAPKKALRGSLGGDLTVT